MNTSDPVWHIITVFDERNVRCLLMGGQACILYGAAEFSRDIDFALLADERNLARLKEALTALDAEVIAVPPFDKKWLDAGLAVHFRCRTPPAAGFRIDVMSRMRGVDDFDGLWRRRNIFDLGSNYSISALSLQDLVSTKKTQRAKDWPMLRRLVEIDYFTHQDAPASWQIEFWLSELRDVNLLIEVANSHPVDAERLSSRRPLLNDAINRLDRALRLAIEDEEKAIQQVDRSYWMPLRSRLEALRREKMKEK